ncbi:nuclear speckle splicing regulatory protein 1 isoform X1 [Trachemys scripta elegans]|uniref:nuclear speckle splicing regulatory protein 1 isoform X1 n=1 Tax=Trachemys scripta elegans TaxID=31138 RepID=UPI00155385BB|nr:nuclear speckle splicing regulatory protein 1 isoform X1 [Trachemys scripta elegans]
MQQRSAPDPKMAAPSKQYGLILPKKALQKTLMVKKHSVFADDSDEETSVGESLQKEALKKQVMKQTKLEIQKALAEDSTVYEYDSIYDEMQQQKKESNAKVLSGKDDKKPKYIQNILKAAEVRKQEQEKRMEKKIQKEREMEGEEFDDKEAFVTSAYKKKLQERAEEEEREKKEAALEACLDVTKQKDLSGFYRHLLNQTVGEEEVPKCSLREARIKEEKSTTNSDESIQRNKSPDERPRLRTPAKEEDNPDADSDLGSDSSDDDHKNSRASSKKKESRDSSESSEKDSKHHRSRKHSSSSESSSEEGSHHTKTHINRPRRGESGTGRREKDDHHKERDHERRDRNQERDRRREKEERHRYGDHTSKDNYRKRDEPEDKQRGKDKKETEGYDKEGRKEKEREDKNSEREREKERLRNGKDRYSDRERGEKCREKEEHLKEKRERDDKDDKKYRDRKESSPRASERDRDKKQSSPRSLEKDRQCDQEKETKAKDRKSNDERISCSERFPEPKGEDEEEGQKGAEQIEKKSLCVSKFAKRSSEETVVSARDRYLARQMARVSTKTYIEKEED